MSIHTGVSGVNGAYTDLEVVSNNIANVNTTGFKKSRAEFGDFYPGASGLVETTGIGVRTRDLAQQFQQGSLVDTGNPLDMAISGEGFFVISDDKSDELAFTRNGTFKPDNEGFVVDADGNRLQVLAPVAGGFSAELRDVQIPEGTMPPLQTSEMTLKVNLDASDQSYPSGFRLDPNDGETYNWATSSVIYDSLGIEHQMTTYFVKQDADSFPPGVGEFRSEQVWHAVTYVDGSEVGRTRLPFVNNHLAFGSDGMIPPSPDTPLPPNLSGVFTVNYRPNNGAEMMRFSLDFSDSTAFDADYQTFVIEQDGYATGLYAGVEVDEDGVIAALATNGQREILGQVALAVFRNPQGLQQLGDTNWAQSHASGAAVVGSPDTGRRGAVIASALEESNVNLVQELVDMINAQRNYQANAQTIQVSDSVIQTIINISSR